MQQTKTLSFKRFRSLGFISLIISAFMLSQTALAADIAGRIIMARGDVQAINSEGVIRQLKRRDSVFSHEIIKTGKASKVQIRFIDNALMALKAESELNIKAYVYSEANDSDNQVLMELVAGGFRTLTGKIGKGNKEAYKVDTPVASIGIRGTLYDVQISFDKILAGVWKGGISLDTAQGQFDLGMNSNFDFGEISAGGGFTGLLTPPEGFTPPTPRTKENSEAENKNDQAQEFSTNDNSNSSNNEASQVEPRPTTNDSIPSPFEKEERPNEDTVKNDESFTEDETTPNDPNDPGTTPTIPDPNDPGNQTPNTSPDLRLTNAEIDQLVSENNLAILLGSGNKNVAIALNTDGTGDTFFLAPNVAADGTQSYETIRRGNATEADFSNIQPWSNQVTWGIWQGSSENPIQRFTEFDNNQDFTPLEKDLFYMLAQPATIAELNSNIIDGTMTFSSSSANLTGLGQTDFIASSNVGSVIDVEARFDLTATSNNYSISNIVLNVDIDTDGQIGAEQSWNLQSASGNMNGASITVDDLSGQLTNFMTEDSSPANGTLNGLLLAPTRGSINTFAGGFDISTTDGSNNAGGVIILQTNQQIPE
jgi:hypothetical protein